MLFIYVAFISLKNYIWFFIFLDEVCNDDGDEAIPSAQEHFQGSPNSNDQIEDDQPNEAIIQNVGIVQAVE